MRAERNVRCKKCGRLFPMRASLANRMIAMHRPNIPRCLRCRLIVKHQKARVVRAYHQYLKRRAEVRRRDNLFSFSQSR